MAENGQLIHVVQAVEELKQQAMATQHRAEAAMKAQEELRKHKKELQQAL